MRYGLFFFYFDRKLAAVFNLDLNMSYVRLCHKLKRTQGNKSPIFTIWMPGPASDHIGFAAEIKLIVKAFAKYFHLPIQLTLSADEGKWTVRFCR